MNSKNPHRGGYREATREAFRQRVKGGGQVALDSLSADELEAMQSLLFDDEIEIVNSACKPYVVARLDKIILPP